jgi:hypothetical protein
MNNLAEEMSALDIDITPITNQERVEYLASPIIKDIFRDGLDIYNPEDKYVILGVPNVYCSKYFDDEDFIYARMKFSDSLDEELDLNHVSYPLTVQRFLKLSLSDYTDSGENLNVSTCKSATCITSPTDIQIHKLSITPLDLCLHPNTIFAKILYLYQHTQTYYTSLRHLRPLERVARLPIDLLEWINNTITIIRYILDNNLFNYTPNQLITKRMFNELCYGLNLIICHARLLCNHYYNQKVLRDMEEKHLKKIMRMANNMCVIMIYFKLAF